MPTLQTLVEEYAKGTGILKEATRGLTLEQMRAHAVPGRWSVLEVLCHVADFEAVIAERMKRVIAMDNPMLLGADETLFAQKLVYQDRDPDEELTIIAATRRQMAHILARQPEEIVKRTGQHNERGTLTLERLIGDATNHIVHHVKFIAEKRVAMGVPSKQNEPQL